MKSCPLSLRGSALSAALALALLASCAPRETTPASETTATNAPQPGAPAESRATGQVAATAAATPGFQKLKGKWLRPDGGYVIEIKSVEDSGKMEVAYYNPKSIHVAKAEAAQQGALTKVFIELRDVNYPGSTYTLTYEPGSDQLQGVYFQALEQQKFEVVFVRMP
jgi:hypothetical protein